MPMDPVTKRTLFTFAAVSAIAITGATLRNIGSDTPMKRDWDCPDFATHAEAQRFYEEHGGPLRDPYRLDADHDGIACERLP